MSTYIGIALTYRKNIVLLSLVHDDATTLKLVSTVTVYKLVHYINILITRCISITSCHIAIRPNVADTETKKSSNIQSMLAASAHTLTTATITTLRCDGCVVLLRECGC